MSLVKKPKLDPAPAGRSNLSPKRAIVLEGHKGPVYSARFDSSGQYVISGGEDKAINLWYLPSMDDQVNNFATDVGHKAAVTSVGFTGIYNGFVSASADGTIGFWEMDTGCKIRSCKSTNVINQIAIHKDQVMSVNDDGAVQLWDRRDKAAVGAIQTKYPLLTCTYDKSGNLYFSGIDPTINAYDHRKLDKPMWTASGPVDSVTSIAFNNDDSVLASRSTRGIINTYNAKHFVPEGISRSSPYIYDGAPADGEYRLIRTCFSNDNISILSGSDDKTVTMWDYSSRKITNKFQGHEGSVLDVAYHPQNKIVMSTSIDGNIIMREV